MTSGLQTPEFSPAWRAPEDAGLSWFRDAMHFPAPLTPFSAGFLTETFDAGTRVTAEVLQLPFLFRSMAVCGYVYNAPTPPVPPEEMPARIERNHPLMAEHMDTVRERWEREYLPEVETIIAGVDALDFADPAADLDRLLAAMTRCWTLHFLVVFPKLAAGERLSGMYTAAVEGADEMEPYRALQGEPNKSLEADHRLWSLAAEARAEPAVGEALAQPADRALAALDRSPEGRAWAERFAAFLREYGQRSQTLDLVSPTWEEDPRFALENLRRFVEGQAEDPEGQRERHLREREVLADRARARLAADPGALAAFEGALAAARAAWPLEEDHAFHIDQRMYNGACHRAALRLGAVLAGRGRIEQPADIFFLDLDTLRARLAGEDDLREAAREGRRAHAAWALIDPPPVIGAPPDPDVPPDPALVKFFGPMGPPEAEAGRIRGAAGSAGVAEGIARVVRDVGELDRVGVGEVLVCRATTPPWTPVFGSIAALVTDTGGVLAHGAIVAREYGIPAVMGTRAATAVIPDGARVRVDGDRGEVVVLG
jgi:pyruvate,water dikinase